MKKAVSITAGVSFIAAATLFGGGASAAPAAEAPSAQAAAICSGSWVKTLSPLKIRSAPDAASIDMGDVIQGELRACRKQVTGKDAETVLSNAHVTVNKNAIPNDPEKPFVTSGIRIGSPAVTTRGFGEIECEQLGHLIADVLDAPADEAVITRTRNSVAALTRKFPVYRA